jgi:hypothetical protein
LPGSKCHRKLQISEFNLIFENHNQSGYMKQQEIFKKIGGIIKELTEQYEYLQAADNHLNDLELELFVANANFLTDHVEILYKMNLQAPQRLLESREHTSEHKFFEPVVQHVTYDIEAEEEKPELHEVVTEGPEAEQIEELITAEETHPEAEAPSQTEEPPIAESAEEPIHAGPEPVATQGPAFNWGNGNHTETVAKEKEPEQIYAPAAPIQPEPENEVVTLNDKIAEKAAPVAETPLSDLKQGITLNDKLLFVKDLFNGYNLAYSEAIAILNRYSSLEDASKFLKTNYVTKNNWNSKPATTEKFYALLKRRYS